ncbi:DUF6923 family protein, partial [Aureivirga sp. CE67]|uniref:DUF7507 domain-containing protein n=1 Tax=Aureivirga sp. CE67 TaxID=1788983 RepID=UPI0018CB1570
MKRILLLLFFFFHMIVGYSQQKKDGDITITQENVCLNRYTRVTADVPAGTNSVTVEDINQLNDSFHDFLSDDDPLTSGLNEKRRFQTNTFKSNTLEPGDLILLYQAQGAQINTSNTWDYGAVTDYNNSGTYEFAYVYEVSGNTITLSCNLENSFFSANYTQVVRIPQYYNMTIDAGASVAANQWGSPKFGGADPSAIERRKGGIVAFLAESLVNNGKVHADFSGFRGGTRENNSNGSGVAFNTIFRTTNSYESAEKGEGIAGYRDDYDGLGGRYGRGAAANGGGGGNSHNAGGGGGANGGVPANWFRGSGVMNDFSGESGACGTPGAWALDPEYIAFGGLTNSSGGGRGGYTYSSSNSADPCVLGPSYGAGYIGANNPVNQVHNTGWAGNQRKALGGLGGRPVVTASYDNQIFLGGGGGAGDGNNNANNDGGDGGGIVLLTVQNAISGNGEITSNGQEGYRTISGGNDAPGGGGAGGTILVQASNISGTISIIAEGGDGGDQFINGPEAEGPGGGGGGGVISISAASDSSIKSVGGGVNGTTTSSPMEDKFKANGATSGNTGTITIVTINFDELVCKLELEAKKSYNIIDLDGNGVDAGDRIEYTITIANNSDVVINDIKLKDVFQDGNGNTLEFYHNPGETYSSDYSNAEVTDDNVDIVSLNVDDSITFKMYYEITQSDIDSGGIQNKVSVEGVSSGGYDVSDDSDDADDTDGNYTDDLTETTFPQNPSVEAEKTVKFTDNGDGILGAGDILEYSIVVVNTGNVTLNDVTLVDTFTDFNNNVIPLTPVFQSSTFGSMEGVLIVDEIATYSVNYTITATDAGNLGLRNSVTVNAKSPTSSTFDVTDVSDDGDDDDGNTEDDPTEVSIGQVAVNPQEPFNCPPKFFQVLTDQLYELDPVSGNYLPIGPAADFRYNALAYNEADSYLYAVVREATSGDTDSYGTTVNNNDIIKIGKNGLTKLTYTISTAGFDYLNASDITDNKFYIRSGNTNQVFRIDLSTAGTSANAVLIATGFGTADLSIVDNTIYGLGNNKLYKIENISTLDGASVATTIQVPIAQCDGTPIPSVKGYGASFVENSDKLYFSYNGVSGENGELFSIIDYDTATPCAIKLIDTQQTSQNDGASCPTAIVFRSDFGDAPDALAGTAVGNYQTTLNDNGAEHLELKGGLYLGTSIDFETDASQNATATGDFDDAVKISGTTLQDYVLYKNESYDFTIPVQKGSTIDNAYVSVWIDFNQNGSFEDAGEKVETDVLVSTTGLTTLTQNIAIPNTALDGNTFARVRVSSTQNIASTGVAPDGEVEDYRVFIANSSIEITKTINTSGSNLNDVIVYDLTIENTGNVTLTDIEIADANADANSLVISNTIDTDGDLDIDSLNAGESVTVTISQTITQAHLNAGEVSNQATVTGKDPNNSDVTDTSDDGDDTDGNTEDDATITILNQNGSIEITKTINTSGSNLNDVIVYDLTIENTGNVTLTDIEISDANADANSLVISNTIDTDGDLDIDSLNAGESVTVTISQTITQAHLNAGEVTNQATVTGKDPNNSDVTDTSDDGDDSDGNTEDDATITNLTQNGSIEITTNDVLDLGADGVLNAGDIITYTVVVSNNGNVTLSDISVTDTGIDFGTNPTTTSTLAVGTSETFTGTYVLTQADIDAGNYTVQSSVTSTLPDGVTVIEDTLSDDPEDATT